MAVGSGLSATFGIATETVPLTPVAVTRFAEFDSETMALKKGMVQGAGEPYRVLAGLHSAVH